MANMPHYLVQLSYTKEAVATLVENPQNRLDAVRPAYQALGVTIREAFLAFGDYDLVLLTEAPDNVQAAAIPMAAVAGGAVADYKTTPLMTWEGGRSDAGCERVQLSTTEQLISPSDATKLSKGNGI